jgi:hypothetical protein
MGHSSIEVTKIYTQFDNDELQEAHDRYSPVDDDFDDSSSPENHDPEESDREK